MNETKPTRVTLTDLDDVVFMSSELEHLDSYSKLAKHFRAKLEVVQVVEDDEVVLVVDYRDGHYE